MTTPNAPKATLVDSKIDVKIKLSALWAAIVFFLIYGDYFALYVPGKLGEMLASKMGMLGPITLGTVTQGALVGASDHAGDSQPSGVFVSGHECQYQQMD